MPEKMRKPFLLLAILLTVYIFLTIGFALRIPEWQPYDEPWHFTYIDKLAREKRMPTVQESTEVHQPPLYYAIMSLTVSKSTPYDGINARLRLTSLILGVFTLAAIFFAMIKLLNCDLHAALVTLIIMNIPTLIACFSSITNDSAAALFGALAFLTLVHARGKTSLAPHILSGLFAALAMLSKATCLFLIPTILLFYLLENAPLKKRLSTAAACLAAIGAAAGWWYLRNLIIYGDPTGSGEVLQMFEKNTANLLLPQEFIRWNALLFHDFWNFQNFLRNKVPGYPSAADYFQLALSVLPLIGGALYFVRNKTLHLYCRGGFETRPYFSAVTSIGWVFSAALLFLWLEIFINSFRVYMPTGRFLFPALVPIFYLWYRGVEFALPKKAMTVLLVVAATASLAFNIYLLTVVLPPLAPMPFSAPF
ncbi:MAG: glycosyltransferase family 39 protein [bacterium]